VTVPGRRRRAVRLSQAAQQQALGTCPGCGKRAYTSKATAKAAARRLYPGARMRAYSCRLAGAPWWHLTSQDAAHTARMRDQQAARPERSRT
jgi:hypothetical protein